ncbi:replicative DNA helicase [Paraburkholderia sp. J63]|uniref:replicative DNA helicase n=1 Tax=Paraburkholderia sp. J63 TaxID=2805434 RepID=UPI002ABDEEE9|nr:DnaB-like helicase N-terminal domain-containing protein [Paraburkholderia sp. J63]
MNAPDTQRALHSVEAEQSVLGGLLLDNDAIDGIGGLRAERFYRADHRMIFGTVTRLIADGGADVVTVFSALQAGGKAEQVGGLAYLNALAQNTPSAANIARYAGIVRDRALKRRLLTVAGEIRDSVGQRPDDAATLVDRAAAALEKLADGTTKQEPKSARDALGDHLAALEARSTGATPAISTGIEALDARLNGGLRPGWLCIVAARPGAGKTSLAMNVAAHVAEDHPVLFCSMEMPLGELNDRLIASLGRVPLDRVMQSSERDREFWESNRQYWCTRAGRHDQAASA